MHVVVHSMQPKSISFYIHFSSLVETVLYFRRERVLGGVDGWSAF